MKILLINPNTSPGITERLAAVASAAASPRSEIIPVTARFGVPYISTRSEEIIGAHATLEILARHHRGADVAIIAAFGDPGLFAARELFPIPVAGLAEAGMLTACMLGRSFSIVTFATSLGPWYRECVERHRMHSRCAGIHCLDEPFESVEKVGEDKEEVLVKLATRAVEQDNSDVVVLAGAPLAGLAERVRDRIPVPVVDCAAAATKQAEVLGTLAPRKAVAGSFRRPAPKPTHGLTAALAARIEHLDDDPG